MIKQRTISKEIKVSGVGIHTGHAVNVVFKPAKSGEGIRFVRTDLPGAPEIKLGSFDVVYGGEAGRYSALKKNDAIIYTVGHRMSALAGLGIDTITIDIDADEAPGLDGSALLYVKALKEAGLVDL
ncbi:MAG: UDP-3-O-acyl-N-acetylglucosamine deacetylase, partial [Candidatus Omnitrophica bacterium]|nr:UDP-3-O-acyl-N-acetylglucosamine deacetylase [Candidatus Omnitrophota bacterium]